MVTLDSLEPEVVQMIVEYVIDSSSRTLKSLSLVNRYIHSATKRVQHRNKSITYEFHSINGIREVVNKVFPDQDALAGVQHLTIRKHYLVSDFGKDGTYQDSAFEPIIKLLHDIGRLRTLTWNTNYPIPISILEALHSQQPTATLRVFDFKRKDISLDHLTLAETKLSQSKALTHLRMEWTGDWRQSLGNDYSLAAFKMIISQAPNLIYAGVISENFVVENHPSKDNVEQLPKLAPLHTTPSSSIRALTLDGNNLELTSEVLSQWNDVVKFDTITNFKFSRGIPSVDYFKSAPKLFPNLKHVSLNFGTFRFPDIWNAAREYLYTCPPLQTISLWAWTKVVDVDNLINQHGSQLQSLQLHTKSEVCHDGKRPIMSVNDLKMIRERCLRLSELTMDLNRKHEEVDFESITSLNSNIMPYLNELALFGTRLDKLQIYIDDSSCYDDQGVLTTSNTAQLAEDDEEESEDDVESDNETESETETTAEVSTTSNVIDNNQSQTIQSPPRKRQRTIKPDPVGSTMQIFVETIWRILYEKATTGSRSLDVKFGDWESRSYTAFSRLFFETRPHDRDDMVGKCYTKMHKKR